MIKTTASIAVVTDNRAKLAGDLTMHSVASILPQGTALLNQAKDTWLLDMTEVKQVSSAAVALLLEWLKIAEAHGKSLRLQGLPEHMHSIIAISGLETLFLPLFRPAE